MKRINKKTLTVCFFYLLVIITIFRSLVFNITDHLIDWGDSAFIAWQISAIRDKILNLDFQNFYTLNTNFPFPKTALFTDSFLFQAIISLPFFMIKNPILVHNLILILTLFLNYITAHLLFKKLFKKDLIAFTASFLINNSFFIYDQIIHLQTLFLWPIFLSILILVKLQENYSLKDSIFLGTLLAIQFASSVYLSIFQATIIGIFGIISLIFSKRKKEIIKAGIISFLTFLILTYPTLIKPYLEFEKLYHKIRDMNEIIMNSGNITDLLFPVKGTLLSSLPFVKIFSTFNKNYAAEKLYFPGIILSLGFILGLFLQKFRFKKNQIITNNTYSWIDFSMLIIFIIGFIFSLGPRLKANGQYLEIPLPYLAILKIFPFLHSLRLTHRWFILSLISMVYFTSKFLTLRKKQILLIIPTLIIFSFESIPFNLKASKKTYINSVYEKVKELNQKEKIILLEWPFLNLEKGTPVDYSSMINLSSYFHKAKVINGYTGIILPEYQLIRLILEPIFPSKKADEIIKALQVNLIKINKQYVTNKELTKIKSFYKNNMIYEDKKHLLIKIEPNKNLASPEKIDINLPENPVFLGSDNRFFLNVIFKNTSSKWYTNLNNDKLTIKFYFLDEKGKIQRKKEYYQRFPIFLSPHEEKKVVLDFFLNKKYKKAKVTIIKNNLTVINSIFDL